jgi:RHS repeat-associated protein
VFAQPVQFRDGQGGWREIEPSFRDAARAGFAWENRADEFAVAFRRELGVGFMRFEARGGDAFALTLEGANEGAAAEARGGSELRYADALPGVDLVYELLPAQVKETLVLRSAAAPASYRFTLAPVGNPDRFRAAPVGDGSVAFFSKRSSEPLFVLSAPIVRDSKTAPARGDPDVWPPGVAPGVTPVVAPLPPGAAPAAAGKVSLGVQRRDDGAFELNLRVDEAWLRDPARVFPVVLDPTITSQADVQDGYWDTSPSSNIPNMSDSELWVGRNGSGGDVFKSALRFDLASVPAGARVTAASVNLFWSGCFPPAGDPYASFGCPYWWPGVGNRYNGTVELRRLTGGWSSSTAWSSVSTDSTLLGSFTLDAFLGTAPQVWRSLGNAALATQAQGMIAGSTANHGFLLELTGGDGVAGFKFASSRYADVSKAPRLDIQWVADGVQLYQPMRVHANGAQLAWQRYSGGLGPYGTEMLADNPAGYWRLDDPAGSPFGASDWTGNANHAALTNVSVLEPGATADGDQAMYFNGSSSGAEIYNPATLGSITDIFTAEAWVKRASTATGNFTIFSRGESSGGGFRLWIKPSHKLALSYGNLDGGYSGQFKTVSESTVLLNDTAWHHVAATKNGSAVKLYIDGVDVTGSVSNATMTAGWNAVDIGRNYYFNYGGGGERLFNDHFYGWIDEAAIYPAALTQARIQAHRNAYDDAIAGFQRYEIHRSATSGFTPSAATLVATLADPAVREYRDTTGKDNTTFHYKVLTVTSSGTYPSNEVSAALPAAGQASVTIQPGVAGGDAKATSITSGNTCANQGAAQTLTVDATTRSLIQFDLRQIPNGATISGATLKLFTFSTPSSSVQLRRLSGEWAEGTAAATSCNGSGASWNERLPSLAWASPGADADTAAIDPHTVPGGDPHWDSWNVQSTVQSWVNGTDPRANLGLLVRHTTESGAPAIAYTSDEYATSVALRPKLEVTYTDGSQALGPQVAVGQPGPNAQVKGASVQVTAGANDDGRVTQVEFLLDGVVKHTDTTAPYTWTWDSTTASRGSHTLAARATDDAGNTTTSTAAPVTVANSNPPTVAAPNASSAGSTWTLSASAADDIGVTRVEFYANGDRVGSDSSSPYQVVWNTLAQPGYDGVYALTAKAFDADGNSVTSGATNITVANTAGSKYQAAISTAQGTTAAVEIPVGAVVPYAGSAGSVPSGWALTNGAAVSRSTYAALFTALGTAYGAGDGSTTFNLPDLRGRIPLGQAASGPGSTLGASLGGLDQAGSVALGSQTYSFAWSDTPPNPTFSSAQSTYNGPSGLFSASTGSYQYKHNNVGPITLTSTQTGTVTAKSVSGTGDAAVNATYSASDPPFRVLSFIVKLNAAAAAPDCAIWPSAAVTTPAGMAAASGGAGAGVLTGCLAPAFAGNLPDLRGSFPLGQATSGTGSALNGTGGALAQTAQVAYAAGTGVATVTPTPYTVNLTVSQPAASRSFTTYSVVENAGNRGYGTVSAASTGSNNGSVVASQTVTLGALSTNGPSGATTSSTYSAPYTALGYAAYTTSTNTAAAGLLSAYGGANPPAGWLEADGGCYETEAYPDLFAAVEYTYGGGGNEFCLPDLRASLPLGKAASGPGSTLGSTGGALNAAATATLPGWTPQLTVPAHSVSWVVPDHTHGFTLSSSGSDGYQTHCCTLPPNVSVIYRTSNSYSATSAAFGGQTVVSTSAQQTVSATAVAAQAVTAPAQNPPVQVVTYLISTGETTATTSHVPQQLRYDPAAGAQDVTPLAVKLTNTSATTWATASVKLRSRWLNADGTELSSSANVSIGADLAAGASRVVDVDVDPPALPASVMRGRYTLRVDLYDTGCACYFAAQGNKPWQRTITVTRVQPDELGLEGYQHYDTEELGLGLSSLVNVANGNHLVRWAPFSQPGRGLSTVVELTYNSLEDASVSPLGNGWSLAVSGLTPFGLPLDVHPNPSDSAAGRSAKWIGFTDSDGSYHVFSGQTHGDGTVYWAAPAGVHLYLRQYSTTDQSKWWALTRPDRVTYFYGQAGYPTGIEDGNGNRLSYTLAAITAGEDAYGLGKRVTAITDAAGQGANPASNRDFTVTYWTKADTPVPALRGKVRQITDHVGHCLHFDYYEDGNLRRITESGGVNADGSHLPDRAVTFTYTLPDGTGPAIANPAARQDPDPQTSQSTRLYSVLDARGNDTTYSYITSAGATKWRLASRTNRAGNQTSYAYNTGASTTTVTRPLSRVSVYATDSAGRLTQTTDPLGEITTTAWTTDNQLHKVTNTSANSAHGVTNRFVEYAYNQNGLLTDSWDELRNHTVLVYDNVAVDGNDVSGKWEPGRTIPHLSQLASRTEPQGVATSSPTTDYKWTFTYDTNGNLLTTTDPLGKQRTNTWNPNGTLATSTNELTHQTTYTSYDANGLPTQITDPTGAVSKSGYDDAGRLLWTQDPNHASSTSGDPRSYRTTIDYDSYGRPGRSSQPKSTTLTPGQLIWSATGYDANDNTVQALNAHYGSGSSGSAATTTSTYDAMDRPTQVESPRSTLTAPIKTQTSYDAAGRVSKVTLPKGVNSGHADDYATLTSYDDLDRVATLTQYELDSAGNTISANTRTTTYCYDVAGDLRSVTAPKGASGLSSCPSRSASPYQFTTASHTTKLTYDDAHRQTTYTDPLGNSTLTGYDANGQPTSITDPNGHVTTTAYTDRGEKKTVVQPFDTGRSLTTRYEYDDAGNLSRLISPRAWDTAGGVAPFTHHVESYAYDNNGRLLKTTLPSDASTPQAYQHRAYDQNGNLTTVTLPTTHTTLAAVPATDKTATAYWDTGWIYSSTDGVTPVVRFDYTPEGWQAARTPETALNTSTLDNGRAMYWDYAPDGLLVATRDLGGQRASHSYDANGNRLLASEAAGLVAAGQTPLPVAVTYDGFDQPATVCVPKPGASGFLATVYQYDPHGNIASLRQNADAGSCTATPSGGRLHTFGYDAADRPVSQIDNYATAGGADDERLTWTWTPTGRESTRTLEKDATGWVKEQVSSRTYFRNGLLKTLDVTDGAATPVTLASHALSYITGGVYLNGNWVSDQFRLLGPDGGAPCRTVTCTSSFAYDARERLTQEVTPAGTSGSPTTSTTTFTLDAVGNVTGEATTGQTAISRAYAGQRLITVTQGATTNRFLYDGQGNLDCVVANSWAAAGCPAVVSGQAPNAALLSDEVYDYANRLAAHRRYNGSGTLTDSAQYVRDPLDRPVRVVETHAGATTTTDLTYIGASEHVATETLTGATTTTRSYAYDATGRRSTLSEGAARFSYVLNPHGGTSLLIDQSRAVKAAYAYSAYGSANTALTKTAAGFNPGSNAYRYSGKRLDSGSGLIDMGARYYNPASGRFLQHDQYPTANANLALAQHPHSHNRYALAAGNPVTYRELDGHVVVHDGGGGGGAYDGVEQAGLIADGYKRLGCNGSGSLVCQGIAEGITRELTVAADPEARCASHTGRYCGNPALLINALSSLVGITDAKACAAGSWTGCLWLAAGVTPVGKAGKLAKLGNTGKAAKAADNVLPAFPRALQGGPANVHVYQGVRDGRTVYVGVTNDIARRQREHGARFVLEPVTSTPVTRGQARAIEEALILRNPGFENVRHAISPNHSYYEQARQWGEAWLRANGL